MRRPMLALAVGGSLALACSLLTGPQPTATLTPELPTLSLPTRRPAGTETPQRVPPTLTVGPDHDADQRLGLLPAFEQDARLSPDLTRYWIDAEVDFEPGSLRADLRGQARIQYVVPQGAPIDEIPLMLWPNDRQYFATMTAGPALLNGTSIEGESGLDGIVLRLRLPESAEPGDVLDISLPFEIEAGGPIGGAVPRRFGITEGVLAAPTFYPLVPRRVDGGWQVEEAPPGGDTTNSDTALYQVDLTYPAALAMIASGVEVGRTSNPDGTTTVRYVSGPMRDFAFVVGPLELGERTVDGVAVRTWSLPEHADDAGQMLEAASLQVELLNYLVGPYPYPELDVVDVPGAFGGIEYPGLVFIGTLGTSWLIEPTVHEVGHQWFYGLIGDDQLHEPWLDEALATFAEVLYYESAGRPGAASGLLSEFRAGLRFLPDPTLPIGMGVGDYTDEDTYALIVYYKGALFLEALRGEIGEDAFGEFLHSYYAEQRYGFASGAEFQQEAEETCGCDLDALFDLWVWQGGEIPGI